MELEIKGHIEAFIDYTRRQYITLDDIKYVLMTRFNKKSLIYKFISGQYLKTYLELVKRLDYGTFNMKTQTLELNINNEYVDILLNKYKCFDKKAVVLTEEEHRILNI